MQSSQHNHTIIKTENEAELIYRLHLISLYPTIDIFNKLEPYYQPTLPRWGGHTIGEYESYVPVD